jgi:hypothetical protein
LKKIQNFESELAWLPSGSRSNHDARLSKKAHTICSSLWRFGACFRSFELNKLLKKSTQKLKKKDKNSFKKFNHFHGSTSSDLFLFLLRTRHLLFCFPYIACILFFSKYLCMCFMLIEILLSMQRQFLTINKTTSLVVYRLKISIFFNRV